MRRLHRSSPTTRLQPRARLSERRRAFAFLLVALLFAACPAPVNESAPPSNAADDSPAVEAAEFPLARSNEDLAAVRLVSAHRGGPVPGYPENAIETFTRSSRLGASMIECDVRETRDGVAVLMHDETLDRTTDGSGRVDRNDWETVRSLRLRDPNGRLTDFRVPTLARALRWAEVEEAILMLDVKPGVRDEPLLDLLRAEAALERVVWIVYDLRGLTRVHALEPKLVLSASVRTHAQLDALLASGVDLDRIVGFVGVDEPAEGLVERLHRHGIRAILGTFGHLDRLPEEAALRGYLALLEDGVDILATDRVETALRAIRRFERARAN